MCARESCIYISITRALQPVEVKSRTVMDEPGDVRNLRAIGILELNAETMERLYASRNRTEFDQHVDTAEELEYIHSLFRLPTNTATARDVKQMMLKYSIDNNRSGFVGILDLLLATYKIDHDVEERAENLWRTLARVSIYKSILFCMASGYADSLDVTREYTTRVFTNNLPVICNNADFAEMQTMLNTLATRMVAAIKYLHTFIEMDYLHGLWVGQERVCL